MTQRRPELPSNFKTSDPATLDDLRRVRDALKRLIDWVLSGSGTGTSFTDFPWVANAAALTLGPGMSFGASSVLSGNSTLVLAGAANDCWGRLYVKQDGTGSRTLTITAPGATIIRPLGVTDDNPLPTANSITSYDYYCATIVGTLYIHITRGPCT